MPEIGDIRKEVGRGKKRTWYYIWMACEHCGKGRWVQRSNEARSGRCRECYLKEMNAPAGSDHPSWRGGRTLNQGYIKVCINKDSPFYEMADCHGYVREHRLLMAQHLGRCLSRGEEVHHIDGNRSNNAIENLELISPANHTLYKQMCGKCPLRKEIKMLKTAIKELQRQPFSNRLTDGMVSW